MSQATALVCSDAGTRGTRPEQDEEDKAREKAIHDDAPELPGLARTG
jgi:hypothetical protein